jgi:hypothetical protein
MCVHDVERVLVRPDEVTTVIDGRPEQVFRRLLSAHAIEVHDQYATVEEPSRVVTAQRLYMWPQCRLDDVGNSRDGTGP